MNNFNFNFKTDPCPNCGKPDAARMKSTEWGHDYMCCSHKCGFEFADKLKILKKTKKYKKLKRKLIKAKDTVENVKDSINSLIEGINYE